MGTSAEDRIKAALNMAYGRLNSFRESFDTARDKIMTETSKGMVAAKKTLEEKNPYLHKKVEETETKVMEITSDFEKQGFCKNYKDYNIELFRPFKRADASKALLEEIKSTLTFKPENPKMAFVMWNVLCFWLGVADFIIVFLTATTLVSGALVVAAADGFAGYCCAYFFYFVFICTANPNYMMLGFIALALYVVTVMYLAYTCAVTGNFLEVVLNILKAIFNFVVSYHGFLLWKAAKDQYAPPKEMV